MIEEAEKKVTGCPCSQFGSIRSIAQALETTDRTQTLIDWLSGNQDALRNENSPLCGSPCSNRLNASLSILNEIRDACRPYLESSSSVKQETSVDSTAVGYEEAFPSLAASNAPSKQANVLVGRKKNKAESKPKRRIRPAAVSSVAPSAWGKPEGNLVHLPSEDPLVLDTVFKNATKTTKMTSAALTPQKSEPTSSVIPKKENIVTPTKPIGSNAISLPKETKGDIASFLQMRHLIDTYIALIESALVPSTVLELHLLIRLLAVPDDKHPINPMNDDGGPLASIFASSARCTFFATQALLRLSYVLRGMGASLWKEIVRCPPLRRHLPELTQELESLLEKHVADSSSLDITTGSHTVLLTLPFNEQRDSRHNYKTREEQALYRNREESRDAFLYQLRAFLGIRGKLVDAVQAEKSLQRIRQTSRILVDDLMDANLSWFSEFFCDLLLQIGLVPLQETDKDILRIADKDKLQKLHKRFLSKAGTATKTTNKLVADKRESKVSSPTTEAQQFFPGHQEFFFLFLISADSYTFNTHLRNRLIDKVRNLASSLPENGYERRLMDMRLIAKFIGLLFFYPNWRASGTLLQEETFSAALDGVHQLGAAGLPLSLIIEKAWEEGEFVAVVPWAVEILRMSTWDPYTRHSKVYKDVLGILRQAQLSLSERTCKCPFSSRCRGLVLLCTETLFDEVVGLARTTLLPLLPLPNRMHDTNGVKDVCPDVSGMCFSATLLCAANPHIEELIGLLSSLSRTDLASLRSPGASRKLRPSVIRPTIDSLSIRSADTSRRAGGTDGHSMTASLSTIGPESIQSKLRDSFFHQHRDLKEVCEITVNRLLKSVAAELPTKCIQPMLANCSADSAELLTLERKAIAKCGSCVKATLESNVEQVLALLSPSALDRQILATASCLAVSHGEELGKAMVEGLVRAEMRAIKAAEDRAERKRLFAEEKGSSVSEESAEQRQRLTIVINAMDSCRAMLSCLEAAQAESILSTLDELLITLVEWCSQSHDKLPPNDDLRSLFQSILLLDGYSKSLIEWSFGSNRLSVSESWSIISKYLKIALQLTRFSRHGLSYVHKFVADSLDQVVDLGVAAGQTNTLVSLLVDLCEAHIMKSIDLRGALRRASRPQLEPDTSSTLITDCIAVMQEQSFEVSALRRLIRQAAVNSYL